MVFFRSSITHVLKRGGGMRQIRILADIVARWLRTWEGMGAGALGCHRYSTSNNICGVESHTNHPGSAHLMVKPGQIMRLDEVKLGFQT